MNKPPGEGKKRIVVFLKAARPGAVKTRIAKKVGAEEACRIYREICAAVLKNLGSFKDVELRYTPDDAADEIQPLAQQGWTLRPQGQGDLGERLHRAFEENFTDAGAVVVIGTDCPEITERHIKDAFRALKEKDLVVGPAYDGGYWLIGSKRSVPTLFQNIAWGSSDVLAQTLAAGKQAGLKMDLLEILSDIDTAEDYQQWLQRK